MIVRRIFRFSAAEIQTLGLDSRPLRGKSDLYARSASTEHPVRRIFRFSTVEIQTLGLDSRPLRGKSDLCARSASTACPVKRIFRFLDGCGRHLPHRSADLARILRFTAARLDMRYGRKADFPLYERLPRSTSTSIPLLFPPPLAFVPIFRRLCLTLLR